MGPAEVGRQMDRLWTAKDVAAYLRTSLAWVYLHSEDGTLPSTRIAGLRRFFPLEIEAYARGVELPPRDSLHGSSGNER